MHACHSSGNAFHSAVGRIAAAAAFFLAASAPGLLLAAPSPCADATYSCSDVTSSYVAVGTTAGVTATTLDLQPNDGKAQVNFPPGFSFSYYGQSYTSAYVTVNGYLSFLNENSQSVNQPIGAPGAPLLSIAAFWDDLHLTLDRGQRGSVRTETRGAQPNREFVIEWNDVRHESSLQSGRVNFQVILHEGGNITLQYAGIDPSNVFETGGGATIGISGPTASTGITYSYNQRVVSDALAIRFIPVPPDTQGPTITINSPANGATFFKGDTVIADYSCADPSGVASCVGPVASGGLVDTSSVGTKAFRVDAQDNLGNPSDLTNSYRVIYNFNGFFSPVNKSVGPDKIMNVVKAGSAIPVKFSLSGYQGMSILYPYYPASKPVPCTESTSSEDIEEIVMAGSSGLGYDPSSDQYSLVWKTDKAWSNSCRIFLLKLDDESEYEAYFRFTR